MSIFNTKDKYFFSYKSTSIASDVGEERNNYSIDSYYYHYLETDNITSKHEVVKNWVYDKLPKDPIPGKKYRETLFTGTLKECRDYIVNVVNEQGHWDKHPTKPFEQIFIEPIK